MASKKKKKANDYRILCVKYSGNTFVNLCLSSAGFQQHNPDCHPNNSNMFILLGTSISPQENSHNHSSLHSSNSHSNPNKSSDTVSTTVSVSVLSCLHHETGQESAQTARPYTFLIVKVTLCPL